MLHKFIKNFSICVYNSASVVGQVTDAERTG